MIINCPDFKKEPQVQKLEKEERIILLKKLDNIPK